MANLKGMTGGRREAGRQAGGEGGRGDTGGVIGMFLTGGKVRYKQSHVSLGRLTRNTTDFASDRRSETRRVAFRRG